MSAPGHIHAVHGFLAAGKTIFARRLERDLPGLRFNTDEWVVALHGPDLGPEEFPGAARRVTAELDRLWPRAAALGLHVIVDYGFWARRHRDTLRAQAALGVPMILYSLSVPADVARERIARRNREPGALHLPADAYDRLWPRYEPPDADEAVVWVPCPDR